MMNKQFILFISLLNYLKKNKKYIKKIGIMTINNSFYINKKPNKLMFGLPILKKYVAEYLF